MADIKELSSVIQIDGNNYNVHAKTAEKVVKSLNIIQANGTTETFDGSTERTITIPNANNFVQSVKIGSTEYKSGTSVTLPAYPTKASLGLSNVSNDAQVKRTEMGVAKGVATLNDSGKVPQEQLPSYIDDVLEYTSYADFPKSGQEKGKIYVDIATNKTYRWSGSTFIEIGGGGGGTGNGDMLTSVYVTGNGTNTNKVDKAINAEQLGGAAASSYALKNDLFSKNYNDLTNKPTIPTKTSDLTNDSGFKKITVSQEEPTSGATGDVWFKY